MCFVLFRLRDEESERRISRNNRASEGNVTHEAMDVNRHPCKVVDGIPNGSHELAGRLVVERHHRMACNTFHSSLRRECWICSQFLLNPRFPSAFREDTVLGCRTGLVTQPCVRNEHNRSAEYIQKHAEEEMPPLMASLHLIPSVGVKVKRKGFAEEQDDVKNHRRSEYPTEFRHDFRITPDEDEDENAPEQGCR